MWQASEAFGFLEVDDLCSLGLYGGPHHYYGDVIDAMEDHPDAYGWGELCGGGHLPPCITPAAFREWAASAVSDERTALMPEMLIWPMCLVRIGAPLVSITMEQSANLLKQTPALAEAIQSEITSVEGFGWAWCSWQIADAADFGASTHRERAWMVATRYEQPRYADHVDGEAAARGMFAHVLKKTGKLPDWMPELRGRTAAAASPSTGLACASPPPGTASDSARPTSPQGEGSTTVSLPDLGVLVGFRRAYPWTYIPARAGAKGTRNVAQMIADAVSPFMGAAISAAVQGEDWCKPVSSYQAALYRLHRQPHTNGRVVDGQQLTFFGKQTLLRTLFARVRRLRPPTGSAPSDRRPRPAPTTKGPALAGPFACVWGREAGLGRGSAVRRRSGRCRPVLRRDRHGRRGAAGGRRSRLAVSLPRRRARPTRADPRPPRRFLRAELRQVLRRPRRRFGGNVRLAVRLVEFGELLQQPASLGQDVHERLGCGLPAFLEVPHPLQDLISAWHAVIVAPRTPVAAPKPPQAS